MALAICLVIGFISLNLIFSLLYLIAVGIAVGIGAIRNFLTGK
jgi:hypothetical protein